MPSATSTSGKAIVSAVLGVLAVALLAFTGVPALLFGLSALREINESDGARRGRAFALTGIVLGGLGTLGCVVFSVALGLLHLRERAGKSTCENNLRRIGQVLNLYHDVHGRFPAGTVPNATLPPERRWSLYSSLLVFLQREQPKDFKTPGLWKEAAEGMHLDEAWDADVNRTAVNLRLNTFVCPSYPIRSEEGSPGLTTYLGMAGVGRDAPTLPLADANAGVFGYDRQARRKDCTGGISNTIMVVETSADVGPWAAGGPSTVRGIDPDDQPYIGPGRPWGGLHPDGANVLMVDGGVVFIRESIDPEVFVEMVKLHRR
jgi:prepilin-type processing-associated H-X9-DG protein